MRKLSVVQILAVLYCISITSMVSARTISFSGYTWSVKSSTSAVGPGPNYFSGDVSSVWSDSSGLHMTISSTGGHWQCTEVFLPSSLGYGNYFLHTQGRFDTMDKNIVAGFFTYQSDTQELDIEFSRWGNVSTPDCGFSVQAPSPPGIFNHKFSMTQSSTNQDLTLLLNWSYHTAIMSVYYGYQTWGNLSASDLVGTYTFANQYVPLPGGEKFRINFWLYTGAAPSNGLGAEFLVTDFAFYSAVPVELSDFSASEGINNEKDLPKYP